MNFTREPIIETIISPRDGFKLLVKSSKGEHAEEYYVDALEVVSFGHSFFFRSLESPKAFLLPTSDYEVVEVKEVRVAVKNASYEKNIKIGGGREAPARPREVAAQPAKEASELPEDAGQPVAGEPRSERRRDRRRHRRRRLEDGDWQERPASDGDKPAEAEVATGDVEAAKGFVPVLTSLLPPPPTLISQTLGRYKGQGFFDDPSEEKPVEEKKPEEPESDSTPLHRNAAQEDPQSLTTTYFSTAPEMDFNPWLH